MSKLFSSFNIDDMEVKNRFVKSATTSYWSTDEGILTDPIIEYYTKLAEGGIGLIIKGHSYVSIKGKAHPRQSGLSSDEHIARMKELTDIVHSYESLIIAQINHGGYTSKPDRATASVYKTEHWEARELTIEELEEIIEDFAVAARNAIKAGFDGVQIHAAHGYLNSQFLSDKVNKRTDEYGGSLKKRANLLINIYKRIRQELGQSAIIGIKINSDDFAEEEGIKIDDTIEVLNLLKNQGLSFAEISGGGPEQKPTIRKDRGRAAEETGYSEATWGGHVKKIRDDIPDLPLIIVDGIRSRKTMDALLDNDVADLISMSKPFINEPDFVTLLKEGQKKSSCIDCRKCISRDNFAKTMLRCFHKYP